MSGRVFIDTNILIYARDERELAKRHVARTWLRALSDSGIAYLNLQVLNEFTRWALAQQPDRDLEGLAAEVDELRLWGDKPLDEDEVKLAWEVRRRHRFQWFDCLLVAAAELAACDTFLTEDMTDRARFESVLIVNPFAARLSDVIRQH